MSNSANQPVSTGRSRLSGGTRRKQLPSPSWQYLVSAPRHEHVVQRRSIEIEGEDVQMVVRIEEQRDTFTPACRGKKVEAWNDLGRLEEHRRHHRTCCSRIE